MRARILTMAALLAAAALVAASCTSAAHAATGRATWAGQIRLRAAAGRCLEP